MSRHRLGFVVLACLVLASLACSLGGGAVAPTNEPPTDAAQDAAQLVPTREPPTVPPVAPTQISTKAPPTAVPPGETPTGTGPDGCILSEQFLADVTIPDGTVLAPGSSFVKTWRVKNTGKCDWHEGVVIAFESGDRLDGPLTVAVGALPVGQQVDVSVPMQAPAQGGGYAGVWRMQDGGGRFFGERLTVNIVSVEALPQPTAAPAASYVPLFGHLYIGVKIYYGFGTNKTYGFEALGGSENCPSMSDGRGVLVRYPDGKTEWKDRMYLVGSGLYYVRRDDPKANDVQWVNLPGCR